MIGLRGGREIILAETKLQQQVQQLENSPLTQQLLDTVPDALLILNQNRQIVFANATPSTLYDIHPSDFVKGIRLGDAWGCIRASQDTACGTTQHCKACGAARALIGSLHGAQTVEECRVVRKDGSALDLRVWGKPLIVNGEQLSIFVARDISHEKRRRALERIFFHDVLNTAGALYGYASFFQEGVPAEDAQEIQTQVYEITERLINEIETQRELGKAENNELTVYATTLNTLDILRSIMNNYVRHVVAEGRRIHLADDAQPVSFISDLTLVRRVVGNMVKNALEACGEGETVTLWCGPVDDGIEFTVHNPSVIPQKVQLQIFQRSFSTKGTGRGLGTYSMKLLTERYLNGRIWFASSAKTGTTFTVQYPPGLEDGD
jgi:signal transduction histidine kinase